MSLSPFVEFLVTKVPIIIVTATFAIGLYQYWKAQRWKRCEFIAKEIKEFENNALVRRAMFMLDFRWGRFTSEPTFSPANRIIEFNTDMLTTALLSPPAHPLNEDQIQVRLAFCDFFEGIERFNYFLETKLVAEQNLEAYLPYWIERFTNPELQGCNFISSIWTFIDQYGYIGVRKLATKVAEKNDKLIIPPASKNARTQL